MRGTLTYMKNGELIAKAKLIPAVTKSEAVEVAPKMIQLTISEDTAHKLIALTGRVHIKDRDASTIYDQLRDALGLTSVFAKIRYRVKYDGLPEEIGPALELIDAT